MINSELTQLHQRFLEYVTPLAKTVLYRQTPVDWQDGFTGKESTHYVDFTVTHHDGKIEHIEVLPASEQRPLTKYLYAQNNLPQWRMITKEELQAIGEEDCETPTWWL